MDALELFPRYPNGPKPVLLLDGHQSRLGFEFLEYINANDARWFVCLGVPMEPSYGKLAIPHNRMVVLGSPSSRTNMNCSKLNKMKRYQKAY
mmetsp:Transcript_29692/g.45503  ORF Transcript_29692/g.45503 Transcript_29692/m.45503 type:complete len:92 (-) Transcript_29692:918-1193(-)